MKVFFDTNTLVSLVNVSDSFLNLSGYELCTFEKCVYELNNGLKVKLFDEKFILKIFKASFNDVEPEITTDEERIVSEIIKEALMEIRLEKAGLSELIDTVKKYDLRFEFGIAEEYQGHSFIHAVGNTGILSLKQFYKLVKPRVRYEFDQVEKKLNQLGINVILYEQVFCNNKNMVDFRLLLKDSYLPASDLEIIFSAISQGCKIFVTDDGKKRGGILKNSRTLGLNFALEFVGIEEFSTGIFLSQSA